MPNMFQVCLDGKPVAYLYGGMDDVRAFACETENEAVHAWEAEHGAIEPDDSSLEIGFDPYSGCYTDDC